MVQYIIIQKIKFKNKIIKTKHILFWRKFILNLKLKINLKKLKCI